MKDGLIDALGRAGCDIDGARRRMLDSDELYIKLINYFVNEKEIEKIEALFAQGDYPAAFTAVHTLKGSSGSLGLSAIYASACEITEKLRNGDNDGAILLLPKLSLANENFLRIYNQYA